MLTQAQGSSAGVAEHEAGQEEPAQDWRGRSSMDLKRYFRGPFVAVLVMLLVFFVVYEYASSGTSYTQTDTSRSSR